MNQKQIPSLKEALAEIEDFRQASGRRYELVSVLLLCCVGLMCGYKSTYALAEWGKNYGRKWLKRVGIKRKSSPSQSTLHRILSQVEVEKLEAVISGWANEVFQLHGQSEKKADPQPIEAVAIDGKKLRASLRHEAAGSYLLAALSHRLGVVLSEAAILSGENEITRAETVIEQICLEGVVITADALHTQKEFARQIVERGGDYLLVVKGNQKQLLEDIRFCFENPEQIKETMRAARQFDTHGNRIEERSLRTTAALEGYLEFPGIEQVLEIRRFVKNKKTGAEREEIEYAVTSLSEQRANPQELLKLWREHWHIENKLHYVRDVTFGEDASQVRTGNLAQTMAALRNVAISGLRLLGFRNIAAGLRRCSAKPGLAFSGLGL